MENLNVRIAEPDDAADLLEIYAPYILNTAVTFEYEVPSEAEFRERISGIQKKYPYLVAESGGIPVGYAYAGEFKSRAAYEWAVETSIYVAPEKKRLGIGKTLYSVLEDILRAQNILNVNACIAFPGKADEYLTDGSLRFHESLGYKAVGEFHFCGCKFGRWYNIVWMEKFLGAHTQNPPAVKWFDGHREELCALLRR